MSTFFVIARLYGYFPMKYARISPAAKGGTVCTSPHSARHAPVRPCHTSVRQCHVPVRQCHVPVRPCHATVRPRHTSMRTCHTLVPFVPRPCVPVPHPFVPMPPRPESAHFMCAPFREMQKGCSGKLRNSPRFCLLFTVLIRIGSRRESAHAEEP